VKAIIFGGNGQLGRGLAATAPADAEIFSYGIDAVDITDKASVDAIVGALKPDLLFNVAAYTAVDKAESDEAAAYAVNGTAVGLLGAAARANGARFIHVSTDFVFDGTARIPYPPDAAPNPLTAYGRTKLGGEQMAGDSALIVRTAWVYAPIGDNFVRTMLRLLAEQREVRVVMDQIGTPTYAPGMAGALWTLAAKGVAGIYHYTDSGVASWFDFAVAIQKEALAAGLLDRAVPVIPIAAAEYPTPALRPHYAVLDKASTFAVLGAPAPHWRTNLKTMFRGIRANG
jgi:dTDP-4-dehydrorhamnose reductase